MSYSSNYIQITLIHPVVSTGQGGTKVVEHSVQCTSNCFHIIYRKMVMENKGLLLKIDWVVTRIKPSNICLWKLLSFYLKI